MKFSTLETIFRALGDTGVRDLVTGGLAVALVKELAPGLRVPFVSRAALIRLKREAGRPQDLADIDQLELLADNP